MRVCSLLGTFARFYQNVNFAASKGAVKSGVPRGFSAWAISVPGIHQRLGKSIGLNLFILRIRRKANLL